MPDTQMKVYAYTRIDELEKAPFFKEIMTIPQITMSRDTARSIARVIRSMFGNVTDFSTFTDDLFQQWSNSGNRFLYSGILNRFFRERLVKTENRAEREWLFGCKKNIYAAVNNIIRLEEAGVTPEKFLAEYKKDDWDIALFLEMWKQLEKVTDNIYNFRSERERYRNPDYFTKVMNHEEGHGGPQLKFRGQKKIIFHGFQFFSPMQQFIFDCFRKSGYDIIILIQAEKEYPYANEIWRQMYTVEKGFVSYDQWVFQENQYFNPLGEIFEHGEPIRADNLRLIKYKNMVEFMADIPRLGQRDDGFKLYSTDDKISNQILRDYYPENYGDRNLLAYPIGQFVYTLHRMWDEELQCITIEADGLRKCFASGWISVDGKSSSQYTEDLERLLPYFSDCYTVDEWRARLDIYNQVYEEAIFEFETESSSDFVANRKRKNFENPFRYFAPFSIDEERLGAVFEIIRQLIDMSEKLFASNEPVSIHHHFAKLDAMLEMREGMSKELYAQERACVKQIFDVLESDRIRDFLCYPGDIAFSLLSLMKGNLEQEEKNHRELNTLVFNMFHIEAAPVAAKGKVHICFADIGKLPGAEGKYSWPIDEKILVKLIPQDNYIENWIKSNKITALSNRYYVYSAMKNEKVEISWVENQGEKVLAPSPYITLLNRLTNKHIEECDARGMTQELVSGLPPRKKMEKDKFSMKTNENIHSLDAEMEYALCPMRYIYSYVLGNYTSYRNEYQQSHAVRKLIQIFYKLLDKKYTMEQVASEVFELFPGIRKAEKRQILDDALRYSLPKTDKEYTTFEGKNYTDLRLLLAIPDDEVYKMAGGIFSMLTSQEGRKGIFYSHKGRGGEKNCELCPHSEYCRRAYFGVDYKREGE